MSHTYTEFFYHFVWGTKMREPYLTGEVEGIAYKYIRSRCQDLDVFVYALDGAADHKHLVCSVPPRLAVAEFVDKIKGASAHFVNHQDPTVGRLYWQTGYGGLTFAKRNLARIVAYVENQKQHPAAADLWPALERLDDKIR